jgi:hypothetical protein
MDKLTGGTVTVEPEGYACISLIGDQTYQTIDELRQETLKYVDRFKMESKPLLGLVDLSQQTGFNTGSNKAALEALSQIDYERAALVSDNELFGSLAQMIIKALGKDDRTKFFKTREEAVPWLLMKDPLKG